MTNQETCKDIDDLMNDMQITFQDIDNMMNEIHGIDRDISILNNKRREIEEKLRKVRKHCQHNYEIYDHSIGSHGTETWWKCTTCKYIR